MIFYIQLVYMKYGEVTANLFFKELWKNHPWGISVDYQLLWELAL